MQAGYPRDEMAPWKGIEREVLGMEGWDAWAQERQENWRSIYT